MSNTPHLSLPYILPSQAQKHVTHNEAIAALDAIVQLAVLDRDFAAPPAAPAEGNRYIVAATATGAWAGKSGQVAVWTDGAWKFLAPAAGWIAWVVDEAMLVFWTGSAWSPFSTAVTMLQNLTRLGIGTTADATNPFSAKLNKALWAARTIAEGGDGDLRYTLNKEAATDVASFLLQTGFSGRAEFGLVGDDDLSVKVSADGTTWLEALRVDRTTARLSFAGQLRFPAAQNASSDANTLDDYEEGTFTPVFTAATAPTGVTYSTQTGRYTKIGRLVLVEGRMTLTSKGTGGAGVAQMSGLPFAGAVASFTTQLRAGNISLPAGSLLGAIVGSVFAFQSISNTGQSDFAWSSVSNNFDVMFSHAYSTT